MASPLREIVAELDVLPKKSDGDIYVRDIDLIAKRLKTDHDLALALWRHGTLASRLLAIRIADIPCVDEVLLEDWVSAIDEWGLCDSFSAGIVRSTPWAVAKCHEWAERQPEFEKRAAFATMAQLAWQKNDHADSVFLGFLPLVEKHAADERYYVKKAVNWALRDIGKRSNFLRPHALAVCERLRASPDKTARWVGTHRIKEITS